MCQAEDVGFEAITADFLRMDRVFVKLVKKQQKELDVLNKRHLKERSTLQKQHCTVVDKMVASHDKEKQQQEKLLEKGLKKKGYADPILKYKIIIRMCSYLGDFVLPI